MFKDRKDAGKKLAARLTQYQGKNTIVLAIPRGGRTLLGLATGSTMLAAVAYCRNKKSAKVIVAVPIAGKEAYSIVDKVADKLIVLEKPAYFRAVAQGYENWYDVPDEEAINILNTCHSKGGKKDGAH